MFGANYYQDDDPMTLYQQLLRSGIPSLPSRRFDEYYRCYPVVMFRGPEREDLEFGGKILMPPSALEKLTRLNITYPMLFELINGQKDRTSHCGVLEFTAEEGKLYLPHWMMQTLLLETGDLVQIKSTDLPSASLVKLQPQSTNFLDISDPKAVLEKAFRNFATLTKGDVFSFKYNDTIYSVEALEVKPETEKMGVSMLETDVSVDFAPPIGYVEPQRQQTSGPLNSLAGNKLHQEGTMAQDINYSLIAPSSIAAQCQKSISSNFMIGGQKLNRKKVNKVVASNGSVLSERSIENPSNVLIKKTDGPQPLRLPPNKLFFGYEIKPVKTKEDSDKEKSDSKKSQFEGSGNTLRGQKRK
ncbi:Ubiquitin fusion degradation protein 1 [Erysiphe neolycopersici]|uniref:Ubiquitin fusion degradation protein 1 n=1 Tax=Erysiphe neolycopersici TaxID=212602 RepID=A0A420HUQ3_9PEZI|nr:Ubiquitin fusion degradation protein 1 [Erysiphe neolycopersici]